MFYRSGSTVAPRTGPSAYSVPVNIDDIRPRKRPATHPINDELKHLARSKRLSRGTIATLLGVQRHHVNNWMDVTPQSRTPQHQLQRLKELLSVTTKE